MRRVLPIVLSLSLVVSGLGFVPTAKMVPDASAAVAGKLSDASQGEILESLDAMGCTPFQKIRYGVLPQLTASFISTTIYRFDINLKDATTLGIVGAGGIGASLMQCLNSRRWAMVGAFIWGLMVLVLIIEFASTKIRRKLARG